MKEAFLGRTFRSGRLSSSEDFQREENMIASRDPSISDEEWTRIVSDHMRSYFDLRFDEQLERFGKVKIQNVLPIQFFSYALVECRDMFVASHYYGCISLCQSVVEGIAKFLIEMNDAEFKAKEVSTKIDGGPYTLANNLVRAGVLSQDAKDAFLRITGSDRNDYHHLNKEVQTDIELLEARALECLVALNVIESEVFAYDFNEGMIVPKIPKYWPISDEGKVAIYFRSV